MNTEDLEKRQSQVEAKADFASFSSDFQHWHNFNEVESRRLFNISSAWRSVQLLATENDFVLSADEKREYKGLLDYRTHYTFYEIERADSHFEQITL